MYKGKTYIYKKYLEPEKVFNNQFDRRFEFLSKAKLTQSLFPKFTVSEDNEKVGYLSQMIKNQSILQVEDPVEKFRALISAKKAIQEIHNKNIIHGDIHPGNILVKNNKRCLIDFDNCEVTSSDDIKLDFERSSIPAMEFINRNGVIKNLDIYMFNVLTFFSFNKLSSSGYIGDMFDSARSAIYFGKYGIFDTDKSKSLCEDIYLYKADDYLINTITEKDVVDYQKKLIYK